MRIIALDKSTSSARWGGKAGHLQWLLANGFDVPNTWVVPPGVSLEDVDELGVADFDSSRWAVRSSASVEDGLETSYAGQFLTVLDVEGAHAIVDAVERVRESGEASRVATYRSGRGDEPPIEMSVIIQRMVTPRASGVAFSRNPMTGLNEVVVEALEGRGDALVESGVTPGRWIERWGDWSSKPPETLAAIPDHVAKSIVEDTRRAAERFGEPVDMEWVWDGARVWWVQLRPITGLQDVAIYSNRISREVMPGMIKPLVWSINVPVVNRAWIRLFTEFIGTNDLKPEGLAKAFGYRSYFNMAAIGDIFEILGMPRDALEMLLGLESKARPRFRPTPKTMRRLPRMIAAATRMARHGGRVEAALDRLLEQFHGLWRDDLKSIGDETLLSRIDQLAEITTNAAYLNIVTPILANLYASLLRTGMKRAGVNPDDVDLDLGSPENAHNPTTALNRLADNLRDLDPADRASIEQEGLEALPSDLRNALNEFLDRFGHLSDSGNDFSVPAWHERPEAVLRLALDHSTITGTGHGIPWYRAVADTGPIRRRMLSSLRRRAGKLVDHREAVSSMYTYGYGLFRPLMFELGRRLTDRDLLPHPDEVMYLSIEEARDALLGEASPVIANMARKRRVEMVDLEDADMPEVIFGDDFVPARAVAESASILHGLATSRGRYRGTLRVVRGIDDSARVKAGDVIAVPFSDVGWTPLFARAGAVIAEAGGMLSHSSIVAREYRIPCVVSVAGATRLPDGATVVVDGYTGVVVVEDSENRSD